MTAFPTPADTDTELADLRHRLASADAGERRVALLEAADLEDEALLPAISAMLRHDPDPTLRTEAARALAAWSDADVVEALAEALSDVPAVREAAALALAELKDAQAGARLVRHARHPDAFVSAAALRGLRELRVPEAVEPALTALQRPEASVRREAVGVLGWLKHQPALPRLAQVAVEDKDAEVRRAAAGALGLAGPDQVDAVLPALCAALRDAGWPVREEAATTLGKLRPEAPAAAQALRAALEDDYWQVRLRAARSLGRLRDRGAVLPLTAALVHPAGNLRKEAAIALGEIGEAQTVPALTAATDDPDPEVRKAARSALQRLGALAGKER